MMSYKYLYMCSYFYKFHIPSRTLNIFSCNFKRRNFLCHNVCSYYFKILHFQHVIFQSSKYCFSISSYNFSYYDENKEFNHLWDEENVKEIFMNRCISKVASVLECDKNESTKLVTKYPGLFYDKIDLNLDKIIFLKSKNVPVSIIMNNIGILKLTKYELILRITLMQDWSIDEFQRNELLPLCELPLSRFIRATNKFIEEKTIIPYGNRVIFLAKILECSLNEMSHQILNCPVILSKDFTKIQLCIFLYEKYGVAKKELRKNLRCFNYAIDRIEHRLKTAKNRGITKNVTPYIVECSETKLQNWLKNQENELVLLTNHTTREEYLADKLKVDLDVLQPVMKKHPNISKINALKLKEMIDFLISAGYNGLQILATPRILSYNIYTLKERLAELKNHGFVNPPLFLLCKTENYLQELMEHAACQNSVKE